MINGLEPVGKWSQDRPGLGVSGFFVTGLHRERGVTSSVQVHQDVVAGRWAAGGIKVLAATKRALELVVGDGAVHPDTNQLAVAAVAAGWVRGSQFQTSAPVTWEAAN